MRSCDEETRRLRFRDAVAQKKMTLVAQKSLTEHTVCCEMDEDWSSRCYIAPDSLAALKEDPRPAEPIEATEEDKQRATRLIAVAMESAGQKRRAA